jgi:hypothetical protein
MVKVVIELGDKGELKVEGILQDEIVMYGLLEKVKISLNQFYAKQAMEKKKIKPIAMPLDFKQRN